MNPRRVLEFGAYMRPKKLLYVVWLCFVLRSVFYCTVFPMWEGFDEYSHFAVIQHIFFHRDIPDARTANSSRETAGSLVLVPVPWLIHDNDHGLLSYEGYWRLPRTERVDRIQKLETLPSAWAAEDADPKLPLYEAQQPPLYYWLLMPFYWILKSAPLPTRVWALRCLTALVASLVIPVGFATAQRVLSNDGAALGTALVIASMPQLMIDACRISNEGLSIAVGSVAILVAVRLYDSKPSIAMGGLLGLSLGATLLTKAYFLALLPWGAFVLLNALRRSRPERRAAARQLVAAVAAFSATCAWFYIRTLVLTGTITGEQTDLAAQASTLSLTDALGKIPWSRVFDFIAVSYIWLGNWSFLVVRTWMYRLIELVALLGFVAVVSQISWERSSLPKPTRLLALGLPCLLLLLGLCYHASEGFRSSGKAGTMGYYLYSLVVPEAILLVVGLSRLLPRRWMLLPIPILVTIFVALEQFGTWFLLLPYYTGFIQHDATGHLPALRISQLGGSVDGSLFERLLVNKPSSITLHSLAILTTASAVAAITLISLASVIAVTARERNYCVRP
jgi:hypothetical protein